MRFWGLVLSTVTSLLTDNSVVVIQDIESFEKYIDPENNFVGLIQFYSPVCGHCQEFKPVFEEIAAELKDQDIRVAKLDALDYKLKKIVDEYEVTDYPTLKLVRNGELIKFDDKRNKDTIIKKIMEMKDPKWVKPEEVVVSLTNADFDQIVDNEEFILVKYYTSWCGHCKKLAPEYEAAASILAKDGIKLAKVDCGEEKELAERFEVTGYPTLKMFRRGKIFDYNGPRERAGIVTYVLEQVSPPSLELNTKKAYNKVLTKGTSKGPGLGLTAFFVDPNDARINNYAEVANDLRGEFQFNHVEGDNVASFGGKDGFLRLNQPAHLQSKYEAKHLDFDLTDKSVEEIKNWIIEHALPLVGALTAETANLYEHQFPRCIVFYDVNFSHQYIKNTQHWREQVLNIAIHFVKKGVNIIFAVADEPKHVELLKKFNLHESGEEINIGCIGEDKLYYPMEEFDEFDSDEIIDFVKSVLNGKAKPFVKSEKVPKTQGDVLKVVAKNFKQIVEDESKDVLIEFYAPWCGHCKSLSPIYDKLGAHFKTDSSMVIAKMDTTANDIPNPDFEVAGFPTIYFKPAGGAPVKYESERTFEAFKTFISENRSSNVKDEL